MLGTIKLLSKITIFFFLSWLIIAYIVFLTNNPLLSDFQRFRHFYKIITFQKVELDESDPASYNNDGSEEAEYQIEVIK